MSNMKTDKGFVLPYTGEVIEQALDDVINADSTPTRDSRRLVRSSGVWADIQRLNETCDKMNQMFFELHDVINEEVTRIFEQSTRSTHYPQSYESLDSEREKSAGIVQIAGKTEIIDGVRYDAQFRSIASYPPGAGDRATPLGEVSIDAPFAPLTLPSWTYLKFDENKSNIATLESYLDQLNVTTAYNSKEFTASNDILTKWVSQSTIDSKFDTDRNNFASYFCVSVNGTLAYTYDPDLANDKSFRIVPTSPSETPSGYRIQIKDTSFKKASDSETALAFNRAIRGDNYLFLYGKTATSEPVSSESISINANRYPIEKGGEERISPPYNINNAPYAPALTVTTTYYGLAQLDDLARRISEVEEKLNNVVTKEYVDTAIDEATAELKTTIETEILGGSW